MPRSKRTRLKIRDKRSYEGMNPISRYLIQNLVRKYGAGYQKGQTTNSQTSLLNTLEVLSKFGAVCGVEEL